MTKTRLLLAEDDQLLAALLSFRLKKAGYEVIQCVDGKEMKEQLSLKLPDVIVSDIMMPYFSGIELVDYVRKELASDIPIIIISSAGNEANVLSAFELGANDFLSKPVSPSELLVRLQREMSKR
ncbi:response regulator transcription factor [Aggregatimonas sangjinii]|uniref:Response regulator transcription factor n=2 Tax=Aggregatimonas sangjinii TaxID=2583587 RepID=A0A5B7SYN8_9FLAO|nr:response regulator transcription factor [Aggregatimonas sangjinii]